MYVSSERRALHISSFIHLQPCMHTYVRSELASRGLESLEHLSLDGTTAGRFHGGS